ncbi:MAG: aminotransferase class V-fold PLP-dependent enzyme [Oscillatoriales cyanobacterium]|nr:MAG: aminotransferase class V-fold PLP-dependent enzyme [Oscillatoriales cyanobacterium]
MELAAERPLGASSLDRDPLTLEQVRDCFPALANKTYFNFGGQGPLPQPAIEAMTAAWQTMQQLGPFSSAVGEWVNGQLDATRQTFAEELGATADTIALTENVTAGCNIALWGIDWRSGDRLLLTDCEHPGVIAAAQAIAQRWNVTLDYFPLRDWPDRANLPDAIAQALQPTTRLVLVSHALWNTGEVLDVGAIGRACRQQQPSVQILVDAAQSIGMLPLDLPALEVDFYAGTGHKWCCGPDGLGVLYVNPNSTLEPTFVGWRGITADRQGNPTGHKPTGQRFEVATSSYALGVGLQASLSLHRRWGSAQERYGRIVVLADRLWQQLQGIPQIDCWLDQPPTTGLVSFRVGGDQHNARSLVSTLEAQGFLLRTLPNPDCARACVHYFSTEADIDRLIEQIRAIV